MDTISLGFDTYFCASWERCIKPFFLDTYIDESAEVGDIPHDARQLHAYAQIIDCTHVLIEFEHFDRPRGSRPASPSSCRISFKVGIPTVGER